jgi:cellulose biosynthesis protein BcsQ
LLIDLDPQGQVASALGLPLADLVRSTGRANLSFVPSNKRTSVAQVMLNYERRTLKAMVKRLPELTRAGVEWEIFDTAPQVGGLQEAALLASDLVIVPTATDYLSSEGKTIWEFAPKSRAADEYRQLLRRVEDGAAQDSGPDKRAGERTGGAVQQAAQAGSRLGEAAATIVSNSNYKTTVSSSGPIIPL